MANDILDIIDRFNDGDSEVLKYFGGYDTFFSFLKKKGLFNLLDPENGPNSEFWQNEYLLWLYENDIDTFNHYILKFLDDVKIINGKPYLVLTDVTELSKLFCKSNRSVDWKTIEQILSGENDFMYDYSQNCDIYDDIISGLTPKNTQILYDHIVNELEGIEVSPDTDELELIASEQGHIDHVVVNSKNINRIVNDKESINELLDSSLPDLRSSLQSLYDSSYNEALFSEYYDSVWDELSRYFIGDKIFTEIPHPYKKDVMVEHISIEIANFYSDLIEYLKDNRSSSNYDTLAYHGTYLTVLSETHGCLRLNLPDYADYRKTENNINSYFGDYV